MSLFRRARGSEATCAVPSISPTPSTRLGVEQLEDRVTPVVLPTGFSDTVFAAGLTQPTAMVVAPDGRIFVAEKAGTLRVVQNGSVLPTPFVSLTVDTFSERGLVGVTLDPNFATNGFVYVYHTVPGNPPLNRISRFTASGNVAQTGSQVTILDVGPSTNGNHNGGALHFGTDGKLYVGVGESGVPSNSQSLTNLLGKVLRINPDGSVPPDNPFVNILGARGEIWALGLRNPFTMAVQPGTGRLFINDVGGQLFEEVNEGVRGANYGWPDTEGDFNQAQFPNFTRPIYAYAHGSGQLQGNSIAGGVFYNPAASQFPAEYIGDYFFGDFTNGRIFLRDNGTGVVTTFADQNNGRGVVDIDLGPAGQLLYLDLFGGAVRQITFNPQAVTPTPLVAAGTGPGSPSRIVAINPDRSVRFTAPAYPGYSGGVRVATGDVTGDGIEDVVTGTGPGAPPHVKVFDGATGGLVFSFFAYGTGFQGGVNVAAADVTGDGRADIVVGTASGFSHVKAFNGATLAEVASFFAYPGFGGGVTVAAGDLTGDGRADIITGTATGFTHVKVFNGATLATVGSYFAFAGFGGGVTVGFAGGSVVAGAAVGPPHVKTFDLVGNTRLSFFAFAPSFGGGVRVGGTGNTVLVGAGPGAGPHLKMFDASTALELDSRFVFEPTAPGGIFVG